MESHPGSRGVPTLGLLLLLIGLCGLPHVTARAQVLPDPVDTLIVETTRPGLVLGTVTTATVDPSTDVTTTAITGGSRPNGGPNLFHSFDFFTVGSNDIAHFQNDMMVPTANIIARIIGDAAGLREASIIDGILRTNNPLDAADPLNFGAANLYVVNPAGVIFGPRAQLDVKGSFTATTADYLRMTDGAQFQTDPVQPSVLTIANVASFGFTNPQPVAINVQGGRLAVATSQTLSMIGGDFTMTGGSLTAPGGRIQIASVASSGEVIPSGAAQLPAVDVSSFSQLGSASISGTSAAFATLSVSTPATDPTVGAGTALVRANQFTANRTAINASTVATNAAPLGIDLQVTDKILVSSSTFATTANIGAGRAGDIRIETDTLQLNNGTILGRAISGTGDGGAIDVNARLVDLNNFDIATFTQAGGRAGNITVHADRLETRDGSVISSSGLGTGSGGDIDVTVKELFGSAKNLANIPNCATCVTGILAQAGFGSRGGSVRVQADNIQLLDGATIQSQLFSTGPGANIDVTAKDILISGLVTVQGPSGPVTQFSSIGSVLSGSFAGGTGGNVAVKAETIDIANNGRIVSTLVSGAPGNAGSIQVTADSLNIHDRGGVFASSFLGTGNSGDIAINADIVTISGVRTSLDPGGVADFTGLSASTATGRGGTIRVTTDDLLVTNKGSIASTTFSSGAAGSISIQAHNVSITDAGSIIASTVGSGTGGSIDINANRVAVSGEVVVPGALDTGVAAITAQARAGSGNAGSIKITAHEIDVLNKGIINNDTLTSGIGGSIELKAGLLTVANGGVVSAATRGTGNAGTITLNTNVASLSNAGQVTNSSVGLATGRAGSITIQGLNGAGSSAQSISLTGANTSITSDTDNTGRGGDIQIRAGQVQLADRASLTAETSGAGRAGSIAITSDNLSVTGGARIEASTQGAGNAGDITITNTATVSVSGLSADGQTRSGIFAKTQTGGGSPGAGTVGGGGGGGSGSGGSGGGSGGGGSGGGSSGGSGGGGQTSTAGNAGDIEITTRNLLLSDGAQIDSSTTSGGAGGLVSLVAADQIAVAGASTRITSDAGRGNGTGGNIALQAGSIGISDKASVTAATAGSGDAGNVMMIARGPVTLDSGATITTSTSGSGKGGSITIQASDLLLDGAGTAIKADTLRPFADLAVGLDIAHLNVGDLVAQLESPAGTRVALFSRVGGAGDNFTGTVLNDQATTPIASGTAPFMGQFLPREPLAQLNDQLANGTWKLNVRDQTGGEAGSLLGWSLRIGSQTFQSTGPAIPIPNNGAIASSLPVNLGPGAVVPGTGEIAGIGGTVKVNVGTLTVQHGALLSATTRGSGHGGELNVTTTGATSLIGTGSGLFSDAHASGIGGDIAVKAGTMMIGNGAAVSAASSGTGDAGNITIQSAGLIQIRGGSVKTTAVTGQGGDITITAGEMALLGAVISANSRGPGNAGNITIDSGTQFISTDSRVTTEATQASGGNIALNAKRMIRLTGSQVSTSVAGGPTTAGGNIIIDPDFVIMQNSQIVAQAFQGQGGNINITAGTFLADPASLVDASSQLGVSGNVNIQAPVTNLSGAITPLSDNPEDAAALVRASCAARFAREGGGRSSLVQRGRDTLPADPGSGFMSGPLWPGGGLVAALLAELDREPSRLVAQEIWASNQESRLGMRLDSSAVMEPAAYCQ